MIVKFSKREDCEQVAGVKNDLKNFEHSDSVWILLNRAPTSTQTHPPTPSSFQPPLSSLQHPQQYSNQNIARNGTI